MNANRILFRGDITGHGDWYGKVEKHDNNTKTLVRFKRSGERDAGRNALIS